MLDFAAEAAADPDFLLEVDHIKQWESEHGPLPEGGWLLYRTGWDVRGRTARRRSSTRTRPGRTRPGSRSSAPAGWPQDAPVLGIGVETVGTDAGAAHSFDPPFPCHSSLLGAGKYGLTQLQQPGPAARAGRGGDRRTAADHRRLRQPVPGAGPGRAILMLVADAVADALAGLGADTVFGVVGSGNFHVTNAPDRAGRPVRRRPARVRRGQHGRRLGAAAPAGPDCCRCTRGRG